MKSYERRHVLIQSQFPQTGARTTSQSRAEGVWQPHTYTAFYMFTQTGARTTRQSHAASRVVSASYIYSFLHVNTDWSPYYEAVPCSVTCGIGVIHIQRNCSTGNNHDCTGSPYDEKPCTRHACWLHWHCHLASVLCSYNLLIYLCMN